MQLEEVDGLDLEAAETELGLLAQVGGNPDGSPPPRALTGQTCLGRDDHLVGIRVQCLCQQLLGDDGAIGVGGVEEGDAQLDGTTQHRDGLGVILGRAPDALAGELHRSVAEADHGQVASDRERSGLGSDGCGHVWRNPRSGTRIPACGGQMQVGTFGAMSGSAVPVPFEIYQAGVYLHGTKADLEVGDLLVAGRESNYERGRSMNYVYFTATLDAATWGAELASGEGRGRIYLVEPTGAFEDDPNVTDKKFPGNPTQSFRSREPLRIVGEVHDWVGHPPEALAAMRAGVAAALRRGSSAIED